MRLKLFVAAFLALCTSVVLSAQPSSIAKQMADIELLKERVKAQMILTAPSEMVVKGYIDKLNFETGMWCDIDYKSNVGSDWKTKRHTERVSDLAKYYVKHPEVSSSFSRQRLEDAIHVAWGYWFREKPVCKSNWFPNSIACPKGLSDSFLLMQEHMSEAECEAARKIVFPKPKLTKTGANLLAFADIVLVIAIFERDSDKLYQAIDAITSTIFIAEDGVEGIQRDYSYHQHGPQKQFGNYGSVALRTYSYYANILKGTEFAFGEKYMDIITNYICQGYNWVLWRGYMDINSSGRQFANNQLKNKGVEILDLIASFAEACEGERRAAVQSVIDQHRDGAPITCLGQKSFYRSDAIYHRTPSWSASLRMSSIHVEGSDIPQKSIDYFKEIKQPVPSWTKHVTRHSTRVVGGEQGGDNRKGYYVADGALYTYVDGDEYENAPVLWDWRRVPGITCFESSAPIKRMGYLPPNLSPFVGTCTDSKSGITTMKLNRDSLLALKTWVVTDDFVLALGSGVGTLKGKGALTTSIEQRMARGELLYYDAKSGWSEIKGKRSFSNGVQRFYHDKSGYIVLDDAQTVASIEQRHGDWNDITISIPTTKCSGDIFSLYVRHRKQDDRYRYLILPARSKEEVAAFDVESVETMRNDEKAVVVKYKDSYYITAFEVGEYKVKGLKFRVSIPGIFMVQPKSRDRGDRGWCITAHDPTKRIDDGEFVSSLQIL